MPWANGPSRTSTPAHRAWRKAVLERDGYLCQAGGPGCLGRATQADHIVAVELGGEELDLANGQALCDPCHKVKTQADAMEGIRRMPSRYRKPEPHPGLRDPGQ